MRVMPYKILFQAIVGNGIINKLSQAVSPEDNSAFFAKFSMNQKINRLISITIFALPDLPCSISGDRISTRLYHVLAFNSLVPQKGFNKPVRVALFNKTIHLVLINFYSVIFDETGYGICKFASIHNRES